MATLTRSGTRPPRRRLPREERAEQLLDVAEHVFAEHGFDGTSIDELARAAGVTKPVIYEHYPAGKPELFLACVRRVRQRYHAGLAEAAGIEEPREQIRHSVRTYLSLLEHDRGRWELLFGPAQASAGDLGQRLLDERAVTVGLMAAMLRHNAPQLTQREAELHAHLLSGAGEQVGRWWVRYPDVPLERVVEMYVEAVWHGIRNLLPPTAAALKAGTRTSAEEGR